METKTQEMTPQIFENAVLPAIREGGSFVLTVTGCSMAPTLHPGDPVLLSSGENIRVGDILLFQRGSGEFILHRCVRVRGDRLTMNGDAQGWTEDISQAQVRAKAVKRCRAGKWGNFNPLWAALWRHTRPFRPALLRLKNPFSKEKEDG